MNKTKDDEDDFFTYDSLTLDDMVLIELIIQKFSFKQKKLKAKNKNCSRSYPECGDSLKFFPSLLDPLSSDEESTDKYNFFKIKFHDNNSQEQNERNPCSHAQGNVPKISLIPPRCMNAAKKRNQAKRFCLDIKDQKIVVPEQNSDDISCSNPIMDPECIYNCLKIIKTQRTMLKTQKCQ
ncbi:hypothetical protein HZS_7553 [Henneguya salminicola]|nr:hypothetical protein HZS_7553 [Henneguya salminicola]